MLRLLIALSAPFALLMAQDRPFVGQVVDEAGTPVARAEVTLTALAGHVLAAAPPHLVHATSDDRGRFRTALFGDLDYTIFALGPARADGRRQVGPVHAGLMGAALPTIVVDRWRGATAWRCGGFAAWGEAAPRRGRARLQSSPATVFEFDLAADGTATLPVLPVGIALFELLDAAGQVLWCGHADTAAAGLELPPPTTVTFHVVDDAGRPIAGALVEQRTTALYFADLGPLTEVHGSHWRRLGKTAVDGTLAAAIASNPVEWVRPFRVRAAGHAMGIAAHLGAEQGFEVVDARGDRDADRAHLHLQLPAARALRGALQQTAERPLGNQDVTVEVVYLLPLKNGGSVHVPLLLSARTDDAGAFTITDAPADFHLARLLAPPSLAGPRDARLPPLLADVQGRVDAFPTVRLDQLHTVDLQVVRADGGPAEGALVVLVSLERRRWFVEPWDPRYRLDRAGRLRFCPPPGEFLLFCTDGDAAAFVGAAGGEARLDLRLEPMPSMTVRVVGDDGKPVPQAQVSVDSYGAAEGTPVELALGAVATSWVARRKPCIADAGGVVRFPCLGAGAVVFQLRARADERASGPFRLQAGADLTVTLEPAKDQGR